MYVVLLLLSVLYRFALSSGFSGDPIPLKPGAPISNKILTRSDTHYLTLKSELGQVREGLRVLDVAAWMRCRGRSLLGSPRDVVGCSSGAGFVLSQLYR